MSSRDQSSMSRASESSRGSSRRDTVTSSSRAPSSYTRPSESSRSSSRHQTSSSSRAPSSRTESRYESSRAPSSSSRAPSSSTHTPRPSTRARSPITMSHRTHTLSSVPENKLAPMDDRQRRGGFRISEETMEEYIHSHPDELPGPFINKHQFLASLSRGEGQDCGYPMCSCNYTTFYNKNEFLAAHPDFPEPNDPAKYGNGDMSGYGHGHGLGTKMEKAGSGSGSSRGSSRGNGSGSVTGRTVMEINIRHRRQE